MIKIEHTEAVGWHGAACRSLAGCLDILGCLVAVYLALSWVVLKYNVMVVYNE